MAVLATGGLSQVLGTLTAGLKVCFNDGFWETENMKKRRAPNTFPSALRQLQDSANSIFSVPELIWFKIM